MSWPVAPSRAWTEIGFGTLIVCFPSSLSCWERPWSDRGVSRARCQTTSHWKLLHCCRFNSQPRWQFRLIFLSLKFNHFFFFSFFFFRRYRMFVRWVVAPAFGGSCAGQTAYGSLWQRKDGLIWLSSRSLLRPALPPSPLSPRFFFLITL